ncbi:MAG: hypothetical protein WBJ82_00785 [Tepidanaerobacteraceae bacterium]
MVGGKSRRGYYIVDKLKKQKMIRAERVPNAHRSKYLVLTKKGAEQLIDEPKLHEYYVRKELVEDILAENEIYRIIVLSKIEHLMSRKDALEYLKLNPVENGLKWLLKTKGLYAVYLRTSGAKSFIEKSIQNAPRLDGHIIVYTNNKQYRDDRRAWLKRLPGPGIYQVTFDKLPYLLSVLKEPAAHIAEFTQKLTKFVSSGKIIQLNDAPVKFAWQKGDTQMLLCDLTTGDLTGPALLIPYGKQELKERGWGQGVIFYVEDKRTARAWARLMKYREYYYFITKDNTALYRIKDSKLVQIA